MNQEHPEEAAAKQIVERVMGIELEHADTHGGVDYISKDGIVALEVTTVTDGKKKSTRKALATSVANGSPARLQACWLVYIPDTRRPMNTFEQRVQPAIAKLELAGETSFDDHLALEHVMENGELSPIYRTLLGAGIQGAVPIDSNRPEDPAHVHRVFPSPGSGGSVSGSNESLDRLMEVLDKKTDNPKKLHDSGAGQRHLFVWLDDDTEYIIGRPLSHEPPSWAVEGWGTPTIKPALDSAITHLWFVHARSRLGWLWDGEQWRELRDP